MRKQAIHSAEIKSQTINMRMRQKVKYGLELLARRQHRSVSDVIETLVRQALADQSNFDLDQLWAETDIERLAKLNEHNPELMSYDEEERWKEHASATLPDRCYPKAVA